MRAFAREGEQCSSTVPAHVNLDLDLDLNLEIESSVRPLSPLTRLPCCSQRMQRPFLRAYLSGVWGLPAGLLSVTASARVRLAGDVPI